MIDDNVGMKGHIINFNLKEGKGLISGDNEERYEFLAMDWREEDCPAKGQRVDFLVLNGKAEEVHSLSAGESVEEAMSRQAKQYGWYKSTNEKIVGGVCAGLARRLNISVTGTRIATIIVTLVFFVPAVIYIVLWLVLPMKNTKHIS